MVSRRVFLAFSAAAAAAAGAQAAPRFALARGKAEPAPLPPLPLSLAIAEEDGSPVRDTAWVDAQIAEAARLYEPLGIPLRKASSRPLGERFARIETRADRDALATALEARRINVMIVASLRDVDDPSLYRMGVHWRHRATPGKHYVIVAASARATTLAHEIGHYFGLGHSDVPDNVMSYDRTGGPVFFDDAQAAKMRAFARMFLGAKLLSAV
jgi:hypothetical protein